MKDKKLSDWAHFCGGDSELDAKQSTINKNPVQKLAVVVSEDFRAVFIDTIRELEEGGEGGGGGTRAFGMQYAGIACKLSKSVTGNGNHAIMSSGVEAGEHLEIE
ncbi:hypothetical protein MHU86_20085 [Fragilaria crotonensis]|nr:hypothetical protein MHU86_20085 [Fragilaria crotonensis]